MEGLIEHPHLQGSEGWLECRRGVITASRAKDARDRSNGLTKQQQKYVDEVLAGKTEAQAMLAAGYKKKPSAEAIDQAIAGTLPMVWGGDAKAYAMDLARERCGGRAAPVYVNAAMRTGTEEEPFAAIEYVARTGLDVSEALFITTPDGKFGMSLDRWVGKRAALEIKTMVSSQTLFKAVVDGDISEYRDQCLFGLWLLNLEWIDLCLGAPDLPNPLHIVRINRDEDEIQKLEDDLVAFEKLVTEYETKLRAKLGQPEPAPAAEPPPWLPSDAALTPARTTGPADVPADIFA